MPLYEYRCRTCGEPFEMLRKMQDADRDLTCPQCRSEAVERLFSAFATGNCTPSSSGGFT